MKDDKVEEIREAFLKTTGKHEISSDDLLGIVYHGKCACCSQVEADLVYGACGKCRKILGHQCGKIARRIRANPEFAKVIVERLQDEDREAFITLFGIPSSMY
jgi:hypothetical protein